MTTIHDEEAALAAVLGSVQPIGPDVPAGFGQSVAADIAQRHTRPVRDDAPSPPLRLPGVTVETLPGMIVRPGDILLLTTPTSITVDQAESIKAEALARMPGLSDVVVFGGGAVAGVYRREEAP